MLFCSTRHKRTRGWRRRKNEQIRTPVRSCRKPDWVREELIRLKALMPQAGCRSVANHFNRLHAPSMSVSKSFVANLLREHAHEVMQARRVLRRRQPGAGQINQVWGLDLTGRCDEQGQCHQILGLIDHGSRRLLALQVLPNKCAWTLLGYLFLAVGRWGRPRFVRTDNERIWTGKVLTWGLRITGIRHEQTALHSPWQNGRIERLFGTLKAVLKQWEFLGREALQTSLDEFAVWYNVIRPHQALNGRTPQEVWDRVDPFVKPAQQVRFFSRWDGLLTGFYIRR